MHTHIDTAFKSPSCLLPASRYAFPHLLFAQAHSFLILEHLAKHMQVLLGVQDEVISLAVDVELHLGRGKR